MIHLTAQTQILLATDAADFRKGIDGFAAHYRQALEHNPQDDRCFVFINRAKTMIRILSYDGSRFWLMTKRLSKGRFTAWPKNGERVSSTTAQALRQLLKGCHSAQLSKKFTSLQN